MNKLKTYTFWVADFEEADLAMLTALLDVRALNWWWGRTDVYIIANITEWNYIGINEKLQLQKV